MSATIAKYKTAVSGLLPKGLNIDKKIVDDSKVTDHHARYYARADYEST